MGCFAANGALMHAYIRDTVSSGATVCGVSMLGNTSIYVNLLACLCLYTWSSFASGTYPHDEYYRYSYALLVVMMADDYLYS